jgi:hypothetical protein
MARIFQFPGDTLIDLPVDQVINAALEANLVSVVIIGVTSTNEEYFASSQGNLKEVLWMLEQAKMDIL